MKISHVLPSALPLVAGLLLPRLLFAAHASETHDAPVPVAPGSPGRAETIPGRCPTFHWAVEPGARQLELAVYEVETGDADTAPRPVLRLSLPGSASGYTPSLAECLARGRSYAWTVRALHSDGETAWAEPRFFGVPSAPSEAELAEALEVLQAYRDADADRSHPRTIDPTQDTLSSASASSSNRGDRELAAREPERENGVTPSSLRGDGDRQLGPSAHTVRRGAAATAPDPTEDASLSLGGNLRLGASSNLFKDGDLLFWDDEDGNTALGRAALASNTFGKSSTAFGTAALRNHQGEDFVGPNFKVASYQTAVGYKALFSDVIGYMNTALGANALRDNTGSFNTAVGTGALLENTSGQRNIAIGTLALRDNSTASNNVAIGHHAMLNNTAASQSTAIGSYAMRHGSGSTRNTAIGFEAMFEGSSSNENTAIGGGAMKNGTGFANTAVGAGALDSLKDIEITAVFTQGNVAVGTGALGSLEEGDDNTALGRSAGGSLVTGNGNVYISNGGAANESNTIRIGGGGHTAAYLGGVFNQTAAGGSLIVVNADGKLGTSTSSRRYKEQIRDLDDETDALFELRPVSFRYKAEISRDGTAAGGSESPLEYGLVAEEVAEVMPELVVYDAEGRPSVVRYHLLIPLLLEELQRQERTIEDQRERLERLEHGRGDAKRRR
jgi:hypothetical protein